MAVDPTKASALPQLAHTESVVYADEITVTIPNAAGFQNGGFIDLLGKVESEKGLLTQGLFSIDGGTTWYDLFDVYHNVNVSDTDAGILGTIVHNASYAAAPGGTPQSQVFFNFTLAGPIGGGSTLDVKIAFALVYHGIGQCRMAANTFFKKKIAYDSRQPTLKRAKTLELPFSGSTTRVAVPHTMGYEPFGTFFVIYTDPSTNVSICSRIQNAPFPANNNNDTMTIDTVNVVVGPNFFIVVPGTANCKFYCAVYYKDN